MPPSLEQLYVDDVVLQLLSDLLRTTKSTPAPAPTPYAMLRFLNGGHGSAMRTGGAGGSGTVVTGVTTLGSTFATVAAAAALRRCSRMNGESAAYNCSTCGPFVGTSVSVMRPGMLSAGIVMSNNQNFGFFGSFLRVAAWPLTKTCLTPEVSLAEPWIRRTFRSPRTRVSPNRHSDGSMIVNVRL